MINGGNGVNEGHQQHHGGASAKWKGSMKGMAAYSEIVYALRRARNVDECVFM